MSGRSSRSSTPGKSPAVSKVAVASKHPGVFMETSELEAVTSTTLKSDLAKKKSESATIDDDKSSGTPSNDDDVKVDLELAEDEINIPRKKAHSKSKRKRVDRSKVGEEG